MRFVIATFCLGFALVLLPGCDTSGRRHAPAQNGEVLRRGAWRAALTVPGGVLPFGMTFEGDGDPPDVYLVNGAERVRIREVTVTGNRWLLRLPAFNSTIDATLEDGRLDGALTLVKRGGIEQVMPFRAVYSEPDSIPVRHSEIDMTGRWEATFTDDEGNASSAIGEFRQDGTGLVGTFLTPTGDYRYLAGEVDTRRFRLSCFDGAHAFLFTGRVGEDGSIAGNFWSGTRWHEKWSARRNDGAELVDPTTLTRLHEGHERFTFDFPDVERQRVTSEDDRFAGKVVVVTLAGSWCPNCHDEAAFLSGLYRAHHASGLEAVGLMYEHYREFDRAAAQVTRFREKYDIPYPLLVAGYSDKNEAAQTLPSLDRVMAYPTIIVIDRRGAVRRIHTGFTGPGTGEHYETFRREFIRFIEELLDEQV